MIFISMAWYFLTHKEIETLPANNNYELPLIDLN